MYDPLEVDISRELLKELSDECKKRGIAFGIIGGWASYFYVNETYRRAFGRDYMGSRDIDVCFDHDKQKDFHALITELGFEKNGYNFRWEKIYQREQRIFIKQADAKKEHVYNLIYIFLDLFCADETRDIGTWHIEALRNLTYVSIEGFSLVDINTLISLKCVALFSRDKADKENKDAYDLYALLEYSGQNVVLTHLLERAIQKILSRVDLIFGIAQYVLLDSHKQNIVLVCN